MKTLILIAAIAVLFNSCGKDGAPGATGPAGTNGNANVNTYTFTTSSSSWTPDGNGGMYCSYVNSSMNLSGGVEVYLFDPTLNGYFTLPITESNVTISTEVFSSSAFIWIYFDNVNGTSTINNPGTLTFKVVTIPKP